jgi:hypothetical protein
MDYRNGEPLWASVTRNVRIRRETLWFHEDARPSEDEAASGVRPVGFFVRVECDVDSKSKYFEDDTTKSLIVDNTGYLKSTFEVLDPSMLRDKETCRCELRSMLEFMLQKLKLTKKVMESIVPEEVVDEINTIASRGPQDLLFSFAIKIVHELLISKRTILEACEITTTHADEKCPICLDYLKPNHVRGDALHLAGCNHLFHQRCIARWLHEKQICPICREDVRLSVL